MKPTYLITLTLLLAAACREEARQADAYGNFESEEIFVAAETAGRILSFSKKEGETLQKDERMALIDTTGPYLQKGQVLASMQSIQSRLTNIPIQLKVLRDRESLLDREVERISNLVKEGAATQKQLDELTGERQVVKSQIQATESQLSTGNRALLSELKPLEWRLKQAEDQLQKSWITAPRTGTLLEKYKEEGEYVLPGMPLAKIANLNNMLLTVYLAGDQLSSIRIGQTATIHVDSPGGLTAHRGTITWVSDKAEFTPKIIQTRTERVNQVYAVRLAVPNNGELKIGMPADVIFE
ncbi:MAG: HlyD family efflux transporter periplasmic adaptor subunit [Cyclobacteriaceae bacterium]|nr:HlyD family efflux transporter periplasmic adaptor subunit [Cyclobacteriaceae bacterium]